MKKIALFLILCIAHVAATDAQNTLFLETPNAPTGNTVNLVRTYIPNQLYVSYHEPGDINVFLLFDQLSFCRLAKLPQGLRIRDFQILNDTLFFCGLKEKNGVFGYMPMSAFNSSSEKIWYDTVPLIHNGYLTKIEVYKDPITNQAVSVMRGIVLTSFGIMQSSFLFIAKTDGSQVYYHYKEVPPLEVTGFDITDNFIVASALNVSTSTIYLSRIEKTDFNQADYITITDPLLNTGVGIEHLKVDDVALYITAYNAPNNQFMSRLYTVDMANYVNIQTQDVMIPQKSFPDEMVYLESPNILLMLQRSNETTNDHSYVYYLNPYNNFYVAKIEYASTDYCNSIDRNGNYHYIAVEKPSDENHYFYTRNVSASASHCLLYDEAKVEPGPEFPATIDTLTIDDSTRVFLFDYIYISSETILKGCND